MLGTLGGSTAASLSNEAPGQQSALVPLLVPSQLLFMKLNIRV